MKTSISLLMVALSVTVMTPNSVFGGNSLNSVCDTQQPSKKGTKHQLYTLPYAEDALDPVMSAETVALHHGKHLQGYVNNLNKLIKGTDYETMSLEEIVKQSNGAIFNNAAQVLNHNTFFAALSSDGGDSPKGRLAKAIDAKWGSFSKFKAVLEGAAMSQFGSGWAWLVKNRAGELLIVTESNAGNPITKGLIPLLCVDVWEHSYYLDYQNKRLDYVQSLWSITNWRVVEARFEPAL